MAKKNRQIVVQEISIKISTINERDYICLTDMVSKDGGNDRIQNWIRNKNTIEFLGAWELIHNENFNSVQFDRIRNEAGVNRFIISPKQWVEQTNAIGIISKTGRYGGTYAHEKIALELATWLNPVFKLYLIEEFERLKRNEANVYNIEWNVKRVLSKVNYTIHTDAVKDYILPKMNVHKNKEWIVYANEADLINVALFQCTAKQWKDQNPQLALEGKNLRDIASINELTVLSNLESLNAIMIQEGISKEDRFNKLQETAKNQLKSLESTDFIKSLKYTSGSSYPLALEQENQKKLSPDSKPLNDNSNKILGDE